MAVSPNLGLVHPTYVNSITPNISEYNISHCNYGYVLKLTNISPCLLQTCFIFTQMITDNYNRYPTFNIPYTMYMISQYVHINTTL